jgi:hypothetical protein
MRALEEFCAALAIDPARARQNLAQPSGMGRPVPWYVQIVTGVGAWITALLMVGFVLGLLDLTIGLADLGLPVAVVGIAQYAAAIVLMGRRAGGPFSRQFLSALAAAGAIMAALGVAGWIDEIWPGALVAVPLAALTAWWVRDQVLQFLVSGAAALWFGTWLASNENVYLLDYLSIASVVGAILYLRPPVRDLRPSAVVLLLMLPVAAILCEFSNWAGLFGQFRLGGSFAVAIHVLLFLGLLWLYRRAGGDLGGVAGNAACGLAAIAIGLLLPPGGSAALFLMLLAFVVGSRPLAVIGIAFESYFLWRFYYDLNASLLEKSILLAGVGFLLLLLYGGWELARKRRAVQ